jgi:SAM-dependent methyltransferase
MQSREKIFGAILGLSLAATLLFWPGSGAVTKSDNPAQQSSAKREPARQPDIHYVPTPFAVVEEMLRMAKIRKGDILYDLGCGDGRIVIAAAKQYGIRGVGIDIDPERIREANENARAAGVTHLVQFREADLFESDFGEATVVTLYLLERLNIQLRPQLLKQLKPGSRIVSHQFGMGDWEPEKTADVEGARVYMWTVPARPPNFD